ncbi:MAG: DUF3089 domain-containing protein [Spirosomataceae bacterium]
MRVILLLGLISLSACSSWKPPVLTTSFSDQQIPPVPNYANENTWAALPTKTDDADRVPINSPFQDGQATAQADVFFIHPTIFVKEPKNQYVWNADVNDSMLNQETDESTILNQASVFNGACRVYAPRYRQAHIYAFYTNDKASAKQAFDIAYADVKAAFEYYLAHFNQGRPIVIASHSQGTVHARRLMKEFFDGKPLQQRLVAAYLIGIATPADAFEHIKTISKLGEVGTWTSWNTYARNYTPEHYTDGLNKAVCTNPLLWNSSEEFATKELNKGGVGLKFKFVKKFSDAQVHQGMLWINKPYVTGRIFVNTKVWHRADINLFYANIRENVDLQVKNFLRSQPAVEAAGSKNE